MDILGSRVILRPRDYEATLAFYRDGLGLAVAREYPGGTVLFAGQSLVEIAAHGGSDEPSTFSGALWLQVRDAAAAAAELADKGIAIDRGPKQEPWGLIELWTKDPDGVPIVLVQIPAEHPLRRDSRWSED
ncbi:MAG TPA: VOC family protein [Nocardia sp.]|uniref:VOC family protein n=1 Tax=Nocardia TaxID=1817 RepID=UPI002456979B|nr:MULTISPECIES: VOC family protein [Nocardia]HLS76557.1 VOC family protein [Nocardia sp.]